MLAAEAVLGKSDKAKSPGIQGQMPGKEWNWIPSHCHGQNNPCLELKCMTLAPSKVRISLFGAGPFTPSAPTSGEQIR